MNPKREMLEQQLKSHAEKLRGLNSYIKELTDMTARHGTGREHFEGDLIEAEHNAKYYEAEMARIKQEAGGLPGGDTILPRTAKQGIGSLILSSIGFVAGAILASRLKSRRSSKDGSEEKSRN